MEARPLWRLPIRHRTHCKRGTIALNCTPVHKWLYLQATNMQATFWGICIGWLNFGAADFSFGRKKKKWKKRKTSLEHADLISFPIGSILSSLHSIPAVAAGRSTRWLTAEPFCDRNSWVPESLPVHFNHNLKNEISKKGTQILRPEHAIHSHHPTSLAHAAP